MTFEDLGLGSPERDDASSPADRPRPNRFLIVATVSVVLWSIVFSLVTGLHIGFAPVSSDHAGFLASDWAVKLLFPVGELSYTGSTLIRAWTFLIIGTGPASFLASGFVGVLALPVGAFHATVVVGVVAGIRAVIRRLRR